MLSQWQATFVGVLVALLSLHHAMASTLFSIDLGSEYTKVGVFSQRFPVDIALNNESQRKTLSSVGFRNGEYFFGSTARTNSIKFPENVIEYFVPLLGMPYKSAFIDKFKADFPYMQLSENPNDGTVVFTVNNQDFTVLELVGLLLDNARNLASRFTGEPAVQGVVAVPSHFDETQQRYMLYATEAADISISQVIKNNVAVAISYGFFQVPKNTSASASDSLNVLFIDMGASSTTATLVSYSTFTDKKNPHLKLPSIKIKAQAYDSTLGGLQFDLRIRDHFVKSFQATTKLAISENYKVLSKLHKQAIRTKEVLSANMDTTVFIDNLLPGTDFNLKYSRNEFEALCSDLLERVRVPIQTVLKTSKPQDIHRVVLFGGAQRVPKIQSILRDIFGDKEISKNINQDESAATGAVLLARNNAMYTQLFSLQDETLDRYKVALPTSTNDTAENKKLLEKKRDNAIYTKDLKVYVEKDFEVSFQKEKSSAAVLHVSTAGLEDLVTETTSFKYIGTTITAEIDRNNFLRVAKIMASFEEVLPPVAKEDKQEAEQEAEPTETASIAEETIDPDTSEQKEATASTETKSKPPVKKVKRTKQIPVDFKVTPAAPPPVSAELLHSSKEKLNALKEKVRVKLQTQEARNMLETLVYETTDLFEFGDIQEHLEGTEQDDVLAFLSACDEWMNAKSQPATLADYHERIQKIKELVLPIYTRVDLIMNPPPPVPTQQEQDTEATTDPSSDEDAAPAPDPETEDAEKTEEGKEEEYPEPEPRHPPHHDDL